jgi:hypothetical protein
VCFWWMHRISSRQDALLTEFKQSAKVQHDILRKEHVVENQGEKIEEIAEQVTEVADAVAPSEARWGSASARH